MRPFVAITFICAEKTWTKPRIRVLYLHFDFDDSQIPDAWNYSSMPVDYEINYNIILTNFPSLSPIFQLFYYCGGFVGMFSVSLVGVVVVVNGLGLWD